ncbi:hypothetical protein [Nocardiopsis quinghaiensis]|uniref:hypothetical protein n=1 Tax=Nocardiopsis quinghaiensis TaxID=464995 RepID=UPI00123844B6|nr:hypothetical protein [Nocardiopsis quinghaiensis]
MSNFVLSGFTPEPHTLIIEPGGFYPRDWSPAPRERWSYRLYCGSTLIFAGGDLGSPVGASEDTVARNAIGFLTTVPSESDAEYLANYTPEQLAWCDENAEYLASCLYGPDGEEVSDLSAYRADE